LASVSACAVVVDDLTDSLASDVARELQRRSLPVWHVQANTLAMLDLDIEGDGVFVGGARLRAAFFRAGPWAQFADGFRADDASFASREVSAAWLAVLNRAGVATVNRPDAELWTTRAEWSVWRRRLLAAGIPCADLDVGAVDGDYGHWLPWGGGVADVPGPRIRSLFASALSPARTLTSAIWYGDRSFPAIDHSPVLGNMLDREGIQLAGITTDEEGRIVQLTGHPLVDEATSHLLAPRIVSRLAQAWDRA
jgi:hypothetical protein